MDATVRPLKGKAASFYYVEIGNYGVLQSDYLGLGRKAAH